MTAFRRIERLILWSGVGLVGSLLLSDPAYSQFLITSERAVIGFMEDKPKMKDAIPLIQAVMNFLRLIFGVYIVYGVVGSFQAIQRDEPWIKPVTPILILLMISFIMDILVPLVVK